MNERIIHTGLGDIRGIDHGSYSAFLGLRYGYANRFCYGEEVKSYEGIYDATAFGDACLQSRKDHEHLEVPERRFYHREFRQGLSFHYSEDCLNMNVYAPNDAKDCPVLVFIHGGGFNSGANSEMPFDGRAYCEKGIIAIFINYRVGVLGYLVDKHTKDTYGHMGNFGLDDQRLALRFIKKHIRDFGGNPEMITVMGQSAGAISIQYLCLNKENEGLFKRAIMISGAAGFPNANWPIEDKQALAYWQEYQGLLGVDFETLKTLDEKELFNGIEIMKKHHSDHIKYTMPVLDGYHLKDKLKRSIRSVLDVDYMLSFTSSDMLAPYLAYLSCLYAGRHQAYLYCFDIDAPGDDNLAFHSSDLRYLFDQLDTSFRPYSQSDHEVSRIMVGYVANFIKTGDPNGEGLPAWQRGMRPLLINDHIRMAYPSPFKLFNAIKKGDPVA